MVSSKPAGLTLPFVEVRADSVVNFWAPATADDYEAQCALGRSYAEALLAEMKATKNPLLFGTVIRAITAAGKYEGVEIGFCSALGIELLGL